MTIPKPENTSEEEKPSSSLKTGQYTIEFSNGPAKVWRTDLDGKREWVCTTSDYEVAMRVVEGLILVEHKRFYYPESEPDIKMRGEGSPKKGPVPKFLQRKV